MANSVVTATGDGVTVQYTLTFTLGILRRDYITCRVGSEVDGAGDPVYRTLEWVSDSIVNVQGTVPANGESIVFTRTVPKNALIHDYSNGVPVEESNLDESNLQTIMAVHEFLDGRVEGGFLQDIQMNGYKILNLGDGTADTDAANMRQLNETTTAANAAVASTAADVSTCTTKASEASASATESENWATKTDGIVESTDYSSKAFAIGGTGVTDTAGRGAAKEWATKAEDSTVDGTEYSAKHYSAKASASAEAASTSVASVNIASPTASKHGALLYQNDDDDGYDALTTQGTSNQVLTSNGADAAPSWQDVSGGAWNLITSQTASASSSIDFTSGIDGTYDAYKVIISDLNPQSSVDFWMLASTDGGSTFLASNYAYQLHYIANGTESVASYSQSANQIELIKSLSGSSVRAAGVEITIYSPSSSQHTVIHSSATYTSSGNDHGFSTCGAKVITTSAVDALRFKMSVSNIDAGTFKLYGVS